MYCQSFYKTHTDTILTSWFNCRRWRSNHHCMLLLFAALYMYVRSLLEFLSNFCRDSDIVCSSCKHFKGTPASWPSLFTLFAALKLSHFNHICAYCLTCCCCCCCCCFCIWLEAGQRAKLRSYLSLWRSVWLIQVWLFHVHTAELLWPACYSWLNTHTHPHPHKPLQGYILLHSTVNPIPTAEQTIF